MKAMGNGKEIKLNKDKSLLSHSGKAFNQEGVGILEVFIFSAATDVGFFLFLKCSPYLYTYSFSILVAEI